MGKDENVMRVDVRVPLGIYERIELLAEKTNQPFTPKTKNTDNPKRVVTPIILKLVELGLKAIDEDSSMLTEELVTTDTDNSETIENRLFERLEKRLEAKIDELIEARLTADTENEYVKNLYAIEINSEKIDPPEDTETIEAVAVESDTEDNSKTKEGIEDTDSLSMSKLAYRLRGRGTSKSTISKKIKEMSKEEFITWSKKHDPKRKGWYLNQNDSKFYPVN
ncbi:hypothetical protein [Cyanobacterium sp. Dongsha4]|uniref:hypothetical protein n=1 Tax=Cyanobacterium sp. DS4 TaxID=2878255 RepID=UPI002E80B3C1|nr:hypothetical protein [Cyanobacterium sp. Dongsha4]WVL02502.1 hypothetical protein Dongsha4_18710 [Cyanobacterium sp. Dongsha4]